MVSFYLQQGCGMNMLDKMLIHYPLQPLDLKRSVAVEGKQAIKSTEEKGIVTMFCKRKLQIN